MLGGVSYFISYHGGTGDDVVLTDSPSPHAANDKYNATENVTVTKTAATGVLYNDSSPSGNPLTVYSVDNSTSLVGNTFTTSTGGRLTLNSDGSLTYVPAMILSGSMTRPSTSPATASSRATPPPCSSSWASRR